MTQQHGDTLPCMSQCYALMLLPISDGETSEVNLGFGVTTWIGKLGDIIDGTAVHHWQESIGTLNWRSMESTRRFLCVTDAGEDGQQLFGRLEKAWKACQLILRVRPIHGHVYVLAGTVQDASPLRLRDVRTYQAWREIPRPFYFRGTRANSYAKCYAKAGLQWADADGQFLETWKRTHSLMIPDRPLLIDVALVAYDDALNQGRIDYRIPAFVRAAESILAVPLADRTKNIRGGAEGFAERAKIVAPDAATHWFVADNDIAARLRTLYKRRSECVHGMLPFDDLYNERQKMNAEGRAVRLEYLAQLVASEAILYALRNQGQWADFKNRKTLEQAWLQRLPASPPPATQGSLRATIMACAERLRDRITCPPRGWFLTRMAAVRFHASKPGISTR